MTHNNDPLAGVPAALDAFLKGPHKWMNLDFHLLARDCKRVIERERQQRLRVEADAAAMREAIGEKLKYYWWAAVQVSQTTNAGYYAPECERFQAALSGSAGAALLAERDLLRARVERLRAVVRVGVGNASVDEIQKAMALEPGDLEG